MPDQAKCRSCGADILWCLTTNAHVMPVDPVPVANGNLTIVGNTAYALRKGEKAPEGVQTFVSHFATCPNAQQHKVAGKHNPGKEF